MGLGQKVTAVACAMGLMLGAGAATRAMAKDGQIRTLAELQRAISPANLDPSRQTRTKRFDGDSDGIKETIGRLYYTKDGGRIAVYSNRNTPYLIAVDGDRNGSFDYARLNSNCDDSFEREVNPGDNQTTPSRTYQK